MSRQSATGGQLLDELRKCPVLGIVRAQSPGTAVGLVHRLVASGVRVVEVSMSTPSALDAIARAVDDPSPGTADHRDAALIGVGTVMSPDQLRDAVTAGAQYVVTPTTEPDVLAAARRLGVPIVPGAATPTEIHLAIKSGATAVKLFPASLWSPRALEDVRSVFPDTPFVPTGGIASSDQIKSWLAAGAVAVGVGSALTSGNLDVHRLLRDLSR